jgi:hypothetical protein
LRVRGFAARFFYFKITAGSSLSPCLASTTRPVRDAGKIIVI